MTTSLSLANENLISVRGNTLLVLGNCQNAWRIQKGTVAVFAVRMKDAAPHGPRRYLFSCNQGDWLFNQSLLQDEYGFLAVGLEDYLVAECNSTARLEQSKNASRVSDLLEGLGHYHRIAFRHLSRQETEEQTRNAQRLEARQRNQQHDTADVLRELGSVLSHKPVVSTSDDPLHIAMTMVGKQLGVRFAFPDEVRSERSIDAEVEVIARRSRIRARNVVLRGHWWTTDSGPILGKWSANGNPIAMIRGERGYSVFDPVEGTTKLVDRSLAQFVSRDATTFFPPLPDTANSLAALGKFALRPVAPEMLMVIFLATSVTLLGMLVPISTGLVIDEAIPDANLALLYQLAAGLMAMAVAQAAFSLSHIEFRYRDDGPLILNDVSIHANPGQFVAIVGPSGSGKSSLLRILLGFEIPKGGSVCFDGQDLAGLDSMSVRRQIGVVLQSGIVNSGSLFDNIAGASRVSLDQAWEAARSAGLAADIEQMPMGMHTFISEGGGTLSGGQRQRLLIARALVTRPKILIFDEATSALDNRTQQIVRESLERMQVTRLVVAHRLSTIREANRIYVLQAGQIVQCGTYQELNEQEGLFKRMTARQVV